MADTETTQPKATPKKAVRKPDPMAQVFNDIRAATKALGQYSAKGHDEGKRRAYDQLAGAWAKDYELTGEFASMLVSHAFEVGSTFDKERRFALIQLVTLALDEVSRLDGGE